MKKSEILEHVERENLLIHEAWELQEQGMQSGSVGNFTRVVLIDNGKITKNIDSATHVACIDCWMDVSCRSTAISPEWIEEVEE